MGEASPGAKEKAGTSKGAEQPPRPFLLSEGLPPVPAKLVGRILKGNFVDMAELLCDNLEAQRRGALHETGSTSASSPTSSRHRREVPKLLSWVQCFSVYTAVVASKHPKRVQRLLAYQTLIVREARRCGRRGWLLYDVYFRQQMAGEWKGDKWGRLNPYLFSSTFLSLGSANHPNCSLCLESDHRDEDCTLAKSKAAVTSTSGQPLSQEPHRDNGPRFSPGRWCVSHGTKASVLTRFGSSSMHMCGVGVITALFTVGHLVPQPLLLIASWLGTERVEGWEMVWPGLPREDARVAEKRHMHIIIVKNSNICLW